MDQHAAALELWGGIEPTVNRVADRYFDQVECTGHASRLDDLDRIAGLGIHTLRYPILWERTAPEGLQRADWSWPDERLAHLRRLGIRPIVGLVHHGSGPRSTSLIDAAFSEQLAAYAGAVARRYPWVSDYTPINEPLTTARFSGLYGHWYPHRSDDPSFVQMLLAQCRGVVLAMRAIRMVNPAARLIQTDDLGKVFSTPRLAYQAGLENQRRWLTWDLLCGRVDREHPLWPYLVGPGAAMEADLAWFIRHPCPPDVVGVNHYLSSERFLDDRLDGYPPHEHGGNGTDRYADVLAARALAVGQAGPRTLLEETWQRYRLPIVVTEAHNGCTREEQLRWLLDVWDAAQAARRDGADVRAVTVWSLLGGFDWNTLLTQVNGTYEPGAFDVRAPEPRPTALAAMARDLALGRRPGHPVLTSPGWWRRPERFTRPPYRPIEGSTTHRPSVPRTLPVVHPLLVTGATGTLGRAFGRLCELRGLPLVLTRRKDLDIADPDAAAEMMDLLHPWAVVNAAGWVRVDDAEHEVEACFRENAAGPLVLAEACARRGIPFVTFSSDLVFDGRKSAPYVESDPPHPLNVYGASKARAEVDVLAAHPSSLVVRTSAFFGPWDPYNFVTRALHELAQGRGFVAASDVIVSPTYVPDLVHTTLDLLTDGESGLWHLANGGATTWSGLARRAAELAGVDASRLEERPTAALGVAAQRPLYGVLGSERGWLMPTLEDALVRYLSERALGSKHNAEPGVRHMEALTGLLYALKERALEDAVS